jgi:hypothetical protein
MSSVRPRQAQAPQPTSSENFVVTDFKSREQWKRAFDVVALQRKYLPRACVLISRLADHFNTKTRQCNPRYDTLAVEMGCSEKTVERAIDDVEPDGWIITKRGGRHDPVNFTLCIPQEERDLIPDTKLSTMGSSKDASVTSDITIPYQTDSASIPDTLVSRHKEQTNRHSAATPRASEFGEIDGPVTKTNGASISRARAPGALDDDIDFEQELNRFAERERAFGAPAWSNTNPTGTTYASS